MRYGVWRAAATALLGGLLFSCAGGPEARETATGDVETVKKEIEVGKAAFAKIVGKYGMLKDEAATAYLNKYVKSLALYSDRQELEYFAAILGTAQVNGYSLPGGYIMITQGALERMDEPGALAGVIAHELGHISLRHVLDNVNIEVRYSFVETLARVLAGSRQVITSSIDQINDKIEERLFLEGYDASDEFDADRYAVTLLQALNVSAEPYVRYLERLDREEGTQALGNLDATHPATADRVARIKEMLLPGLPELQPTDEFRAFRATLESIEVTR